MSNIGWNDEVIIVHIAAGVADLAMMKEWLSESCIGTYRINELSLKASDPNFGCEIDMGVAVAFDDPSDTAFFEMRWGAVGLL